MVGEEGLVFGFQVGGFLLSLVEFLCCFCEGMLEEVVLSLGDLKKKKKMRNK